MLSACKATDNIVNKEIHGIIALTLLPRVGSERCTESPILIMS